MRPLSEFGMLILAAFIKRNQRRLRKLNDEILCAAAMNFTVTYFNLAIFSYVLSKIVSKPRFLSGEYESCLHDIELALKKLADSLDVAGEEEILNIFSEIQKAISYLEERDPRFVIGLVTKGKLKMAATLYAQGMSLGIASEMTGMEKQEILNYAGETMMFDRLKDEKGIHERMKFARKLIEE